MSVNEALLRLFDALISADVEAVDGCGYCFDREDLARLHGPVAEIPPGVVSRVAGKTPDHWGDFDGLYRKLTPRIMAMLVAGELTETSLIADRYLQSGCWTTWPASEREAMLDVCRGWWLETLADHPGTHRADDVIEFLATTPVPLAAWLALWDQQPPGPADRHAVDLCRWWIPDLLTRDLDVGFAHEVQIADEMTIWVLDQGVARVTRVTDDPMLWLLIDELRAEHARW